MCNHGDNRSKIGLARYVSKIPQVLHDSVIVRTETVRVETARGIESDRVARTGICRVDRERCDRAGFSGDVLEVAVGGLNAINEVINPVDETGPVGGSGRTWRAESSRGRSAGAGVGHSGRQGKRFKAYRDHRKDKIGKP